MEQEVNYSDVSVLLPCLNEELTIARVVQEFKEVLPGAQIYVFDNNSDDKTAEVAKNSGALVVLSPKRGKGNVVQHMFDSIDSPLLVMADGDGTYPANSVKALIQHFKASNADMVVGSRFDKFEGGAFRKFHLFGNRLVAALISRLFKVKVTDVMSGYRVFSKDFTKSVPLMSAGFEIETEMTLQAAAKGFKIAEIPIEYGTRMEGSYSKLNTYSDGFLVIKLIFMIFKDYKPFVFFSLLSAVFAMLSITAGYFPIMDYYREGFVYHVPLAILAAALGILSTISFAVGLILDTVGKFHRENFELIRKVLKK